MDKLRLYALRAGACSEKGILLSVSGKSMLPLIREGDSVRIFKVKDYFIGNVIVYVYKGELLVHRLLENKGGRLYCKGDNSFRIEDIKYQDIIGKVMDIVRNEKHIVLPDVDDVFCRKSLKVGRLFVKLGRSIVNTQNSKLYKEYIESVQALLENVVKV